MKAELKKIMEALKVLEGLIPINKHEDLKKEVLDNFQKDQVKDLEWTIAFAVSELEGGE